MIVARKRTSDRHTSSQAGASFARDPPWGPHHGQENPDDGYGNGTTNGRRTNRTTQD